MNGAETPSLTCDRVPEQPRVTDGPVDAGALSPHVQTFGGHSLASSTLQSFMHAFAVPDVGYVAYAPCGRLRKTPIVLSDPLCAPGNLRGLVAAFDARHPDAVWFQVFRPVAEVLDELGYFVNEFGTETFVDIPVWDLAGKKKQNLRSPINAAHRDGIVVKELMLQEVDLQQVCQVPERWLRTRVSSDKDFTFLVRPATFADEPGVRRFYALKDGRIIAFVIFDPLWRDGQVVGYAANNLRSELSTSAGVTDFILLEALNLFRAEGRQVLALGLSPFHAVDDRPGDLHWSWLTKNYFQWSFEHLNHVFEFKGLAFHKRRFRPDLPGCREERVYLAARSRFPVWGVYKAYRRTGINPVLQTLRLVGRGGGMADLGRLLWTAPGIFRRRPGD